VSPSHWEPGHSAAAAGRTQRLARESLAALPRQPPAAAAAAPGLAVTNAWADNLTRTRRNVTRVLAGRRRRRKSLTV
jgi:hypothetical protein